MGLEINHVNCSERKEGRRKETAGLCALASSFPRISKILFLWKFHARCQQECAIRLYVPETSAVPEMHESEPFSRERSWFLAAEAGVSFPHLLPHLGDLLHVQVALRGQKLPPAGSVLPWGSRCLAECGALWFVWRRHREHPSLVRMYLPRARVFKEKYRPTGLGS